MKPVPGASGEPVNWLNYKTGKQHVFFKMDADNEQAIIAIEIKHKAFSERENCYHQFLSLKTMLVNETGHTWEWEKETVINNNLPVSRISQSLPGVNILNEKDWPAIIAFFKPRIIGLDNFWDLVKDSF